MAIRQVERHTKQDDQPIAVASHGAEATIGCWVMEPYDERLYRLGQSLIIALTSAVPRRKVVLGMLDLCSAEAGLQVGLQNR